MKNITFVEKLPYLSELKEVYADIIEFYLKGVFTNLDITNGSKWVEKFITLTEKYHDLIGMAEAIHYKGFLLIKQLKYEEAFICYQKSIDICNNIGDNRYSAWSHLNVSEMSLNIGDIERTEEQARLFLEEVERIAIPRDIALAHHLLGCAMMCKNEYEKAIYHYRKYLKIFQDIGRSAVIANAYLLIGMAHLKNHNFDTAIQSFKNAIYIHADLLLKDNLEYRGREVLQKAFAGIEEVYMISGTLENFYSFCFTFQKKYNNAPKKLSLKQLYLQPDKISEEYNSCESEIKNLDAAWSWICDPPHHYFSYNWLPDGIEIYASKDIALNKGNYSAPRLVKEVTKDFAIEGSIKPLSDSRPQIGGILIWKDRDNFIRFEKGTYGKREMLIEGYVNGEYQIVGRGLLPASDNDETYLRLERSGDEFASYCSIDGENWFTCGKMTLPMEDPIQVGIHAIGMIDRTIYCGEYKEGTATLFRNFRLWTK